MSESSIGNDWIDMILFTVETLYSTIYYSKYFIELNMISLHNKLPFELTKDTPYLALSGELCSVFYEYFNRNWSCYKGFLLYNFWSVQIIHFDNMI